MRILLTGGTGFFGKAFLRHYLSLDIFNDHEVVIISRDPERFKLRYPRLGSCSNLSFITGDIQIRSSLPWRDSFSHILHAATDSTIGPSLSPLQRYRQIHDGTTNILDLAVETGASRFLLTSSGGIYGPQPANLHAIPEDWPSSPPLHETASAYSQGKRAAEHLCALYREAHGIETVVARCFSFVGPDLPLDAHFAIGNFIRDALVAEAITVAGDGSPVRSYLDQRDLAHWIWNLLLEGIDGETYNVGSDEAISIGDLAHLVRDIISPGKPVCIHGKPQEAGGRNRYIPCINKIRSLHDLGVRFKLPEAITYAALGIQHNCSAPDQSQFTGII